MKEVKGKKRKVSKKTKKSWRKNVDIKDVDKFLEHSRLEERLGGSFQSRKDSDLFVVHKEPEVLSRKERRELLRNKEARCFEVLKPHTSVADPIAKRNRVRTPEERRNELVVRKEALRKSRGILKLKEKTALRNRAIAERLRAGRPRRGEFKSDVWEKSLDTRVGTDWMAPDTVRHVMAHFGRTKKRLPSSLRKKPSALPAIEIPHPGASYNPSFEDHQNLLREVAAKEMELKKQEEHLERVTTKMFKKVTHEEKEKNRMEELLQGLETDGAKEDEDVEDEDPNVKSVNPPVKNAKKTRVQRRKQKEQRELTRKKQLAKVEKKKVSDIYRLKQLDRQLAAKEKKQKMLRDKRLKKEAMRETVTRTLSKIKFEPLEPEFKLSEELVGNLRNSAPSGNLLKDRFKSLQQRNIVAPSTIKLKQKAKVKRFIKPDHKIELPK